MGRDVSGRLCGGQLQRGAGGDAEVHRGLVGSCSGRGRGCVAVGRGDGSGGLFFLCWRLSAAGPVHVAVALIAAEGLFASDQRRHCLCLSTGIGAGLGGGRGWARESDTRGWRRDKLRLGLVNEVFIPVLLPPRRGLHLGVAPRPQRKDLGVRGGGPEARAVEDGHGETQGGAEGGSLRVGDEAGNGGGAREGAAVVGVGRLWGSNGEKYQRILRNEHVCVLVESPHHVPC